MATPPEHGEDDWPYPVTNGEDTWVHDGKSYVAYYAHGEPVIIIQKRPENRLEYLNLGKLIWMNCRATNQELATTKED